MKIKGIIEFITILIIVLLLYFVFILNIDKITLSYNGRLADYNNTYYKASQEPQVLDEIRKMSENNENKDVPKEVIKSIQNNKIIRNIIKEFSVVAEEGVSKYVEGLKRDRKIDYISEENIIYIKEDSYELAFTLDINNIIYQEATNVTQDINWEDKEITIENKYDIYKKVEKELERLGITEKFNFEPESIYFSYALKGELDSDGYIIEDNKNEVKLNVRSPDYTIEKMQIGFTKSLLE